MQQRGLPGAVVHEGLQAGVHRQGIHPCDGHSLQPPCPTDRPQRMRERSAPNRGPSDRIGGHKKHQPTRVDFRFEQQCKRDSHGQAVEAR